MSDHDHHHHDHSNDIHPHQLQPPHEVFHDPKAGEVARAELERLKSDLVAYLQDRSKIKSESAFYAFWRRYEQMQAEIPVKDAEIKGLLLQLAPAQRAPREARRWSTRHFPCTTCRAWCAVAR